MAYSVEKDIENISRKRKKRSAKKRAGNEAFDRKKAKKKAMKKEGWVARLKRTAHELIKGDKAYAKKKKR
jgi:hypothetical protein